MSMVFAASLLALVPVAHAKDKDTVAPVQDTWSAHYRGARKIGWSHARLEERRGASTGFVRSVEEVTRTAEGLVRTTRRIETDAGGRVRRYTRTTASPWGESSAEAEPRRGGLRYRVQLPGVAAQEGSLEDCWDADVTVLLVQRGAQPPGKRTIRVLDLPGDGAKEKQVEVVREGEGWRVTIEGRGVWTLGDDGVRRHQPEDVEDEVWLPATAEDATDFGVSPPGLPAARTHVAEAGLRVGRPGPDWSLQRRASADGTAMLGAEHPGGLAVFVMTLAIRLPAEEVDRLRVADGLRKNLNSLRRSSPTRDGLDLGRGEALTWRGLPAVSYPVGGTMGQAPLVADVLLVGLPDGSSALILVGGSKHVVAARAAELEAAGGLIEVGAAEVPWERVTLGAVSVELPRDWKRPDASQPRMTSQVGASQLLVHVDRLPEGVDLRQAQDAWVGLLRADQTLASLEVERAVDDATIDGRRAHVTVTRGTLREVDGVTPGVRLVSCAFPRDDGSFVEVSIMAFDLDWDLAALDRVLGSIRLVEEK